LKAIAACLTRLYATRIRRLAYMPAARAGALNMHLKPCANCPRAKHSFGGRRASYFPFRLHGMKSKNIVILTGAGISAESGIDTFRAAGGLWENHKVEDVATPQGYFKDPQLVHNFYNMRRAALKTVKPNAAHIATSMTCMSAAA